MLFTERVNYPSMLLMNNFELKAWVQSVLDSGISATQWAKKAGYDRANFIYNFLSKPRSGLKYETVQKLEKALEEIKQEGNISIPETNISLFKREVNQKLSNIYVNELVPVYGNASAGSQGAIKLNEDYVVDQTLRHPGIASVKDSFALYVDGDSMSPRREHGELIYIHPYKPPEIGKECVVVMEPEGNVLFKRYLGKSKDGLHLLLKQFNPLEEFSIPLKSVRKIYSVVF